MTRTLEDKNVVVVGLGKSGLAAAELALAGGARVVINDKKSRTELTELADRAASLGIELALGDHPDAVFARADLVVLSPGVPTLAPVERARARGVEVVGEVELAAPHLHGTVVGITGTNGKSTVTTLVGEMMKKDGRPTFAGGNLGDALSLAVGTEAAAPGGAVVAELSSFQLEDVSSLRCQVAVLLNVTDDHLDRHGTLAEYARAKARIFEGQTSADHAVVPAGDELCLSLARAGAATVHTFYGPAASVRIENGALVDDVSGLSVPVEALGIRGLHNQSNACAAALAARLAGCSRDAIEETLRTFRGLPHRMVLARTLDGVDYFDDSKATNVGATVAAIEGLRDRDGRIVLIAGGVDKGGSYAPVRERMEALGRGLVLIGQATSLIEAAFAGSPVTLERATTIDDAVARARRLARPGDAVLLAPACSSFDMFRSYAHRGDEFVRAVNELSTLETAGGAR